MTAASRAVFPPWFRPFARRGRYKCVYGGRSSSKTYTLSLWLILASASKTCRIGCARQFQASIDQSVKPSMEWAIHHLGLHRHFRVNKHDIYCPITKSVIFFKGIERNIESIKGWHDLTHVWFEEAQTCKEEAMDIIIPTIMRGESETEAWFTWNPRYRSDWIWKRFVLEPRAGDIIRKISYKDNPWHTVQAEEERLADLRLNPLRYAHIWEGNPDDGDGDTIILPFDWLTKCVQAYRDGLHGAASRFPAHGGLDIADGGKDSNWFVARNGPVLEWQEGWHSRTPGFLRPTAERADRLMTEYGGERLYYDGGGVGAPIRADFHRMDEDFGKRPYSAKPVLFGGRVEGKDRVYWRGKTNAEYFLNRSGQLAFNLRARAQNTVNLMEGQDVDLERCLFINPDTPRLEEFLAALSQPQWYDNPTSGKVTVDKRGDLAGDSPDPYDATALAFARDSEDGLRK